MATGSDARGAVDGVMFMESLANIPGFRVVAEPTETYGDIIQIITFRIVFGENAS